uniref:Integrase catalytic domain-containing protein n=1 Tax=Fagus sylvatica TaxID=28930 RepID=A0A2N9GVI4_FAGSY
MGLRPITLSCIALFLLVHYSYLCLYKGSLAFFRCLSCLRHCPAATVRNPVACAAKKLIHRRTDLLPPSVLPLQDSNHNTSAAVGKISRSSTQPCKNQPHTTSDAPPRAAQSSGAVILGSPATGLRSRHIHRRWKDLEKTDPTAQEFILIGARTRRHAPVKVPAPSRSSSRATSALALHCHVSPSATFLKGRKLWLYVTGQRHPPTPQKDETEDAFALRLEDWDGVNHQIITWLRNTSTPSVSMEFGGYDTAKDVWDMLASRYAGSDGAREHHLMVTLYQLRQDPGERITAFHSRMRFLWDQLAASEPVIKSVSDAQLVSTHRERTRLHQFLMGVLDDFESVRSQLLNRSPLPTVNQAVNDLVREETRLKSLFSSHAVLPLLSCLTAPPKGHDKRRSNKKNSHLICAFCKHRGHTIDQCNMRARILQRSAALTTSESVPSSDVAPFDPVSLTTPTYSIADLQALFNQVQVPSSSASNPALSVTPGISSEWFLDSACCNHMTDNPHLTSAHTPPVLPTITTADGSAMTVSHVGSISTPNLSVSDVFCVPKLHLNLLSVGQLTELGLNLFFSSRGCLVQDSRTGQIVGTARKVGRLFELTSLHFPSSSVSAPVIAASASIELWHSRLGHVSLPRIQTLVSRGLLGSVSSSPFDCMPCQLGKQPALPFNNSESIASATFDLIHSDVWGPSPVPTTQYSKAIKVFRSDNAREYRQTDFSTILKHYGTIFHTSCAGTSQQNGRAERKLRHILDTVRALTNAASTPVSFWGEAALTAVYTINRCPSPVVQNTTPYERLFGTAPNYSLLKVFGCVCFVLLQPHERTKLQPRSQLCCFLGYGLEEKGYRCYDPVAKRLRVSRHVVFWEHKMFYSLPSFSAGNDDSQADPLPNLFPEIPSPSAESVNPISDESPSADPSSDVSPTTDPTFNESPLSAPAANPVSTTAPEPRRSHRVSTLPSHLRDFHCFSAFATLHEPHTFREASSDPLWQQAMKEELDALLKTGTWDLVDLPAGKSAIGCKWVYKIKTRSDGTVDRYKARLVAKGFTQEYGIDYEETFAPVARLSSVRTLIAVSASRHWPLFQMDVKNAFLNGELTEEVYMQLPPGFSQPPGFSHKGIQDLKRFLGQHFEMKDLGPLSYFLGLEVSSSSDASWESCLSHCTRPDISYAVHIVSQFMAAPRSLHYAAVLRILRGPTDRRSTTGYCFLLGDSLISWRSKKQSVVARSSTEAEYRALADTTAELLWLRWLLQDLGIDCSTAVPIHCDNQSAIQIAHNDVFHERTKHIEIDCHFVRHHLLQGTLQLRSVSSQDQLADIFTKPMPPGRFRDLISKLKLVSLHPT